ncbi:hypothetical protein LCGC14_2717580, partial [marine sediment metagenome]
RVDFKKINFAPTAALIAMPRFWRALGERMLCAATCTESRAGNLYMKPDEDDIRVHSGRKFKIIQQLEQDKEYECLVQVMEPNPDVSKEHLKEIEKEFGADQTIAFIDAQKHGYQQLHFASVVE